MKKFLINYKTLFLFSVLIFSAFISYSALFWTATRDETFQKDNEVQLTLNGGYKYPYFCTTDVVSAENGQGCGVQPSLIADKEGNIHLVYTDNTEYGGGGTDFDIFYKFWNASLNKWALPQLLNPESDGDSYFPYITSDNNGTLHVLWAECSGDWESAIPQIYHKTWNVTTGIWSENEVVVENGSGPAAVTDQEGNLHIVWYDWNGTDNVYNNIYYKVWDASLNVWNTTELVSTESTNQSLNPSIKLDKKGNKHVVWLDYTNYSNSGIDGDIFYRVWDASLKSWNATELVSIDSPNESSIVVGDALLIDEFDDVHVVWSDQTGVAGLESDYDVFYRKKDSATNKWSSIEELSTQWYGDSLRAVITNDPYNNIHVAWDDDTPNYPGQKERGTDILYKWYNSTTKMWSIVYQVSGEGEVNNQYDSDDPAMIFDKNGNSHIAWADLLDYKGSDNVAWDIFARRLIFNNTLPEISHPDDVHYEINGTTITWFVNDLAVNEGTYIVRINGEPSLEGTWSPHENITIPLRPQLGLLNYTLMAFDGISGYVSDSVNVEVSRVKCPIQLLCPECNVRSYDPYVIADEYGLVHFVWNEKDNIAGSGGGCDIIYMQYNPLTGATKTYVVSSETSDWYASSFGFVIDNKRTIHFTWAAENVRQFNSGPDHDIWYRTYRIDTDEWTHTEYVSNTLGNIGESGLPNIDVDLDGNVYIVWRDNSNIYDNGTDDTDIFYRTKSSVTREWSQTEIISTDHYLEDNIPHVQVDSEKNVYVCWDGRNKYILFRFFNQTAKTWSSIYQVNAYSNRSAYFNDMTLDINENLNFVWTDTTNYGSGTDHDIYYVFLNLTTFSFSPPYLISKGSAMSSVFPRQTTDKWGRVHIVWNEGMDFPGYGSDNDIDVAYCSFDMKTQTQSPIELISTESTRDCSTSSVSVDELGNVHIIYMDATDLLNSGPDDDDIFYRLIVYNNTPPEIRDGADLNYEHSTLGHSIRWTINDRTLYSGTYKILRNGIVIATGNWKSGSKISFNVDGLDQGFWNFTIVVNDGMYSITQDTIIVHVGPLITPYLIALIVTLSITLSVIGFLLYFKKKGYILSKNALKVFISYAEEDYDRFKIEELADSILMTKKVELVFYYKKDMKGDIVSWMEKTVALCQIFLFIASDSSLNSKGCAYELYNAKSHDVSIIPILDTNIEFEQLRSFNNKEYSFEKMHFQLENLDLHKRFGVKMPQDATGSIDVEQLKLVINKEIKKFESDLDKVRVEFKKSAITNVITVERNIEVNRNDIYLAVRYLVQLGYLEGAWDSDKTQFIVKKEVLHRLNLIKGIRKYDNIEQMILEARFHKDSSEYIQSIFKSPFNKPSNLEIPLTRK